MFRTANLELDSSAFTTYEYPTSQVQVTTTQGPGGEPVTSIAQTTTWTSMPWIGNNPPEYKATGHKEETY
jgi:hypothetical protein